MPDRQLIEGMNSLGARLLQLAVQHVDEIVYIVRWPADGVSGVGEVVFISDRVRDILGHAPDALMSDRHLLASIMHPEDRATFDAASLLLHASGSRGYRRCRLRHRDTQGYVPFIDTATVQTAEDGALYAVGALRIAPDR